MAEKGREGMTTEEVKQIIVSNRSALELARRLADYMSITPVYQWMSGKPLAKLYSEKIEQAAIALAEELQAGTVARLIPGVKPYKGSAVDRLQSILALYESGLTLQQIADVQEPKLTRERVRQLLKKTDYQKKRRASPERIQDEAYYKTRRQLKDLLDFRWSRDEVISITGYSADLTNEELCEALYREYGLTRMSRYVICILCKKAKTLADCPPSVARANPYRACNPCNTARTMKYIHRKADEAGMNTYQYQKATVKNFVQNTRRAQKNHYSKKQQKRYDSGLVAKRGSPEFIEKMKVVSALGRAAKQAKREAKNLT